MAQPRIKSYDQYLGEAIAELLSASGLNDISRSSIVLAFLRANARLVSRANGDVLQVLRDSSIDRETGDVLIKRAYEEGVSVLDARPATGPVKIIDTSFEKVSTKIYPGTSAPNVGALEIRVSGVTGFPASGNIYIGRGTSNFEGPIPYSSITPEGGYFKLNLSVATKKFHNISESVILAQGGNRKINSGTIVQAPGSSGSSNIKFETEDDVTLLDGENEVSGVVVVCTEMGISGKVPRNAIREFASPPFSGASVLNDVPFTNGRGQEQEESLRARIKLARLSRGLGVASAIQSKVQGSQAPDEAAVASAVQIVRAPDKTTVFVDDGTGYERKTAGVGLEVIVDKALGGEDRFSLSRDGRTTGISKAFLESQASQPFEIYSGDKLAISVGGIQYEHTFSSSDFRSPGAVTAYEIVASINGNTTLGFTSSTSSGGQKVTLTAKADTYEYLNATTANGNDANNALIFPETPVETIRLFKNGIPLSKDGKYADISSSDQSAWGAITTGDTIKVNVDKTGMHTYTVTDADFVAEGTYLSVSSTNSLQSWAEVLSYKIPGVTASVVGNSLLLRSNKGLSSRSSIEIDPTSTLVTKNMFSSSSLSASGLDKDFYISRYTGQIGLVEPLVEGDRLTAGIDDNNGFLSTDTIPGGTVVVPNDGKMWVLQDDADAEIISHGAIDGTDITISKIGSNTVRYTSSDAAAFSSVAVGDYVIVYSRELLAANRFEGRVAARTNSTFDIRVTNAEYSLASAETLVPISRGIVFVRTKEVPEIIKIDAGTYNVYDLAILLNAKYKYAGMEFFAKNDDLFMFKTLNSEQTEGSLLVVGFEEELDSLGLLPGEYSTTKVGSIAFAQSSNFLESVPMFYSGIATGDAVADIPDTPITVLPTSIPGPIVATAQPFGRDDSQPGTLRFSRKSGDPDDDTDLGIRRIRNAVDRFFTLGSYNFGVFDSVYITLDQDTVNKSFSVPLSRKFTTNSLVPTASETFNAYDTEAGATASIEDSFGSGFSFNGYNAHMRAKLGIQDTDNTDTKILLRSTQWGRTGEEVDFSIDYPTVPQPSTPALSHLVSPKANIRARVFLKAGPVLSSTIYNDTEWNFIGDGNTPNEITVSWTGNGTEPVVPSTAGYLTITSDSGFAPENQGTYRFYPINSTSFTIVTRNNNVIDETDVVTTDPTSMVFFEKESSTAQEIIDYINLNLSDIITAESVDTDSTGLFEQSTLDSTGYDSESFLDGYNAIQSTDLSNSPQFVLEDYINLPAYGTYDFYDGEEIYVTPITPGQVVDFVGCLAVSGITTESDVSLVNHARTIQISSKVPGSYGSVQIVGGPANNASMPVVAPPTLERYSTSNTMMTATTDKIPALAMDAGQRVYLQAQNFQKKDIGFNQFTTVEIRPGFPTAGKSTIEIGGRRSQDRFFGHTRVGTTTVGTKWKIEKQGKLACLSWDPTSSDPFLQHGADVGNGGSVKVVSRRVSPSELETRYLPNQRARFTEYEINDADNLVVGISNDRYSKIELNEDIVVGKIKAKLSIPANSPISLIISVDGVSFEEGVDWSIGIDEEETAQNISDAIILALPGFDAEPVFESGEWRVLVTVEARPSNIEVTSNSGTYKWDTDYMFSFENVGVPYEEVGVQEGDTVWFDDTFHPLNRGYFRVIRSNLNNVWFENPNAVSEDIVSNPAQIALDHDTATGFVVSGDDMTISWDGVGDDPNFSKLRVGDFLDINAKFDSFNQGTRLTVTSVLYPQPEITELVCGAGSSAVASSYFVFSTINDDYYVWYKVGGVGTDPAVVGRTGLELALSSSDSANDHAQALSSLINSLTSDITATHSANVVVIKNDDDGSVAASANTGSASVIITTKQTGNFCGVTVNNPGFVSEGPVYNLGAMEIYAVRPEILFWPYESVIPGDKVIISGTALGQNNVGTHTISEVLGPNRVVIGKTMEAVDREALGQNSGNIAIEERSKFSAYKTIKYVYPNPGESDTAKIGFFEKSVYQKVTSTGAVQISTIGKLGFSTDLKKGQDGYRYDTGLLAEVNRIIAGDPRDPITYPGVGAAGVDIMVEPPLQKRIQVSIVVRVRTGIPFAQTVESIRNSVSALIMAQPLGESLAISSIVSATNDVPGVFAVSISSPQYDPNNDVISIGQNEKAIIIDPVADIVVSEN